MDEIAHHAGSRNSDGNVPNANWNDDRFNLNYYQLADINSGMQQIRSATERLATNMPIQGTAADIMKMAMIAVHAGLHKVSPSAKLLMQVHDELVLECPKSDADRVSKFVQEEMESVAKLKVPIVVEAHVGDNWEQAH